VERLFPDGRVLPGRVTVEGLAGETPISADRTGSCVLGGATLSLGVTRVEEAPFRGTDGRLELFVDGALLRGADVRPELLVEGRLELFVDGRLELFVDGALLRGADVRPELVVEGRLELLVDGRLELRVDGVLLRGADGRLELFVEGRLELLVDGRLELRVDGALLRGAEVRLELLVDGRLELLVDGALLRGAEVRLELLVDGRLELLVDGRVPREDEFLELEEPRDLLDDDAGRVDFESFLSSVFVRLVLNSVAVLDFFASMSLVAATAPSTPRAKTNPTAMNCRYRIKPPHIVGARR